MTAAVFAIPHTRQPRARLVVRPEFNPIGGVQPGGFGLDDVTPPGGVLTLGSGITLVDDPDGGRALDTTVTNAGLTKDVGYTNHPFSFVCMGRIRDTAAGGVHQIGSLATAADKLVRVFLNVGFSANAQHLGATTVATATTGALISAGAVFTIVGVFRAPNDVQVYAKGNVGIASARSTTNVGALGTLTKFSIGVYDGSVKANPLDGRLYMAQWLRCALDPSTAWAFVNNPWALYQNDAFVLPFDAPVGATFNPAWARAANSTFQPGAMAA